LNTPDETTVKVEFMDGKLESSVVLPKGLYPALFHNKKETILNVVVQVQKISILPIEKRLEFP